MRLVLASANPDKAAEIAAILEPVPGLTLVPRPPGVPEVDETGSTLVENARLKASALVDATGLAAVADDTGLEVEALGGAPGGYSARYSGEHATYAENVAKMKEAKEGFTLIKQAVGFHNPAMMRATPNGWYDEPRTGPPPSDRGLLTERGLAQIIACVEAMKKVLGDEIGLALDCGPGWTVKDAITFARALEPLHIAWLEDIITGDYTP